MADRLKAGMVWVNTYRMVSYMAPFGGYKRSGLGRENGIEAINEYMQTKTVWMSSWGRALSVRSPVGPLEGRNPEATFQESIANISY